MIVADGTSILKGLQSLKVSQFVGKGDSTVQRPIGSSIGSLIGKAVLREEELEGATRLGFEDHFSFNGLARFRPRQPDRSCHDPLRGSTASS